MIFNQSNCNAIRDILCKAVTKVFGRCATVSVCRFNYKDIEQWIEIFLTEFKEGGQHENNKET